MSKRLLVALIIVLLTFLLSASLGARVKVGESVKEKFETTHPYSAVRGIVWEREFHWPGAGYIAIHFSRFNLAPGDYVEISSPDGQYVYTYKEKGKKVRNGKTFISTFWASHIPADTAMVRLYSKNRNPGWGFVIDQWAHGYEPGYIQALISGYQEETTSIESICSSDDKEWAQCYQDTPIYDKSKTVTRLLIGGVSACTGWLVGSEGHIITNNHCISTQSDADNTDYEFMAEGTQCNSNCATPGGCPGVVEASSGTLVKTNASLDYTLIRLPTNLTGKYGYLQLRNSLPTIGERIYIPQHPNAWGKQIAVTSDVDGGYCQVYSTNETPCNGGPGDIGYYADTAAGSSGSPLIAYQDHLVIALHHCANCPNRGVPIYAIISDLAGNLPVNAIPGPINPPTDPGYLTATATTCNQVNLTWQDNSSNENGFKIERSTNGSPFSLIATITANSTAYNDTTVAENSPCSYRVKAYNTNGDSGYSNIADITTPACPLAPPDPPTNLRAKPGKTNITLAWTDNSTNETGFRLFRGTTSGNLSLIANLSANTTSYNDLSLPRRTRYYYKVCATNTSGERCSSTISARTK